MADGRPHVRAQSFFFGGGVNSRCLVGVSRLEEMGSLSLKPAPPAQVTASQWTQKFGKCQSVRSTGYGMSLHERNQFRSVAGSERSKDVRLMSPLLICPVNALHTTFICESAVIGWGGGFT